MPYKDPETERQYRRNRYWAALEHHREMSAKRQKRYRQNNLNKVRARNRNYIHDRRNFDVDFKLAHNLRVGLNRAIAHNQKEGSAVKDLGCSIEQLKLWFMYQFQPGMTWENYGEWEIDHVKPLSSFDLTNREQFLEACNWYNLQPLWQTDNRSKGNK